MPRLAALVLALAASPFAACQCGSKQEARPASSPSPASSTTTGGPAAPAPAPGDPASAQAAEITGAESLRRITELADKICACADRVCAEAERVALDEQNKRDAGRPRAKPTPAEADGMRDQAKRIADCVDKLK
jgi:hypothetical protein